ncbi:MAG: hypothetical protein F4Y44_02165 [Chloroflexi bacterium]|nr:hypothetical protein [Chloroflexota bacterium]
MGATLFLEAFGRISGPATINSREEDLHSVFRERAELMRWATTSNDRPLLWLMEEAEITADTDTHRIGWVQVGLGVGPVEVLSTPTNPTPGWVGLPVRQTSTNLAMALVPLVQCFDDSLRRFGVVELAGLQVTVSTLDADTQSCIGYLVSVLNWFNTDSKAGAEAIVAFDQNLLEGNKVSELLAILQRRNTYPFEFRTFTPVSDKQMVSIPLEEMPYYPIAPQPDTGMFVTLPEWTPSAAGWVLASVIDAARLINPSATEFAVRLTRFQG